MNIWVFITRKKNNVNFRNKKIMTTNLRFLSTKIENQRWPYPIAIKIGSLKIRRYLIFSLIIEPLLDELILHIIN